MNNRLSNTNLRMTFMKFSRGCPYSCYFCATPQKEIQLRSGISIRDELQSLITDYGIEGFRVVDDCLVHNNKKYIEICKEISDLGLKWSTVSRIDTITPKLLQSMKKAGCIEIIYGIESGSDEILSAMNKDITAKEIIKSIELTHSIGIGVKVLLIHGFPEENFDTTQETISLLKKLSTKIQRVSLTRFVPLPGSYIYKNHKRFNLHIDDDENDYANIDWSRYHLYDNDTHWWGSVKDFEKMNSSFTELEAFIQSNWTSRF